MNSNSYLAKMLSKEKQKSLLNAELMEELQQLALVCKKQFAAISKVLNKAKEIKTLTDDTNTNSTRLESNSTVRLSSASAGSTRIAPQESNNIDSRDITPDLSDKLSTTSELINSSEEDETHVNTSKKDPGGQINNGVSVNYNSRPLQINTRTLEDPLVSPHSLHNNIVRNNEENGHTRRPPKRRLPISSLELNDKRRLKRRSHPSTPTITRPINVSDTTIKLQGNITTTVSDDSSESERTLRQDFIYELNKIQESQRRKIQNLRVKLHRELISTVDQNGKRWKMVNCPACMMRSYNH